MTAVPAAKKFLSTQAANGTDPKTMSFRAADKRCVQRDALRHRIAAPPVNKKAMPT